MLFRRPFFLSPRRVSQSLARPPSLFVRVPLAFQPPFFRKRASPGNVLPRTFTDAVATHPRYATSGVTSHLLFILLLLVVRARSRMCGTKVTQFLREGLGGRGRGRDTYGDFCPSVSAKRGRNTRPSYLNAHSLYVINNRGCKNACAIQNCGLLDCDLNRGPIY